MNSLAELQRDFHGAVTTDTPAAEIFGKGMGDPMHRLAIYRNAYRSRLREALRANYPVLAWVMGDEAFSGLALQYIDARPSRHPSIRWFGDELPEFAGEAGVASIHPALCDLIRLEWAISLAFDAPDAPAATREALLQLPADAWPGLRLRFHPSVSLLDLAWSVEPIWQQIARDIDEATERDTPEPRPHEHSTVVWREGLAPRWRSLDPVEAACLRGAILGEPFALWCERTVDRLDANDAPATVIGWLQGWLADGLIAAAEAPA